MRQSHVIPEVVKAVQEMSERTGALIVLEKEMALKNYETGTPVDARVSAELIEALFTHPSPLHDGAIVIQNDRVVAAECTLPLSQDQKLAQSMGMRHRAGLGLSEESDALVIIISEETGAISFAEDSKLYRKIDLTTLKNELFRSFGVSGEQWVV